MAEGRSLALRAARPVRRLAVRVREERPVRRAAEGPRQQRADGGTLVVCDEDPLAARGRRHARTRDDEKERQQDAGCGAHLLSVGALGRSAPADRARSESRGRAQEQAQLWRLWPAARRVGEVGEVSLTTFLLFTHSLVVLKASVRIEMTRCVRERESARARECQCQCVCVCVCVSVCVLRACSVGATRGADTVSQHYRSRWQSCSRMSRFCTWP